MNFQDIPVKSCIELDESLRLHISPISLEQYQKKVYHPVSESTFALKVLAENNKVIDPVNEWLLVVQPEKLIRQGDYVLVHLQDELLAAQNLVFTFLSLAEDGSVCVKRLDHDDDIFLIPPEDIAVMHVFQAVFYEKAISAAELQKIDAQCFAILAHEIAHNPTWFYSLIESCQTVQTLRAAIYSLDDQLIPPSNKETIAQDAELFQFFMQEKISDSALLTRFLLCCKTQDDFREALLNPLKNTVSVLDKISKK